MLRIFFKTLNVIALVVLLCSCLATYISPTQYWQLAFLGFAFPVVLVVNFFFLLLWIAKRDSFGLISLVAIALTWNFIHATFAVNFTADNTEQGVKVLTWNVKNFDLYNWNKNTETREQMMALIKKENADVLCLQEFYTNNQLFHNLEYLRDTLGYKYVHFFPSVDLKRTPKSKVQKTLWKSGELHQQWGVATFSKFPMVDTGVIDFENSLTNNCIFTDLNINGKVTRLYNVHFQSIHLGYDDYATLDSIEVNQSTRWAPVKNIMRKMKRAYTKRAQQANAVAESVDGFNGHKILCGDFNDVPVSYTYSTARHKLQDAFIEKSKGFGATFANKFSIFRIDYTFFDSEIKVNSYRTISEPLSDHYPVAVTFSL
ncbi:MAG TPA: endonuclease/exonuclease/phosphatase family protein [Chitinophagales bacterium]|nr:endonuclease/exonuclease/phosphatase family protein [Chitinophagales bacterium]